MYLKACGCPQSSSSKQASKQAKMKSFSAIIWVVFASTVSAGHLGRAPSYAPVHSQVSSAPQHSSSHYSQNVAAAAPLKEASVSHAAHSAHSAHSAHAAHAPQPRLHEIHTSSGRQYIRVEEYARPNQLIRVHEQPQAAPEVIRVQAPGEDAAVIRVIAKSSGPAHVERIVHRSPSPQVINVHKPAPPPARIVQVVRAPAAAPRIEFHYEESPAHEVHIANAPSDVPLPAAAPHVSHSPQPININLPENNHAQSGPIQVSKHTFASPVNHGPRNVQTRVIDSHSAQAPPTVTVSAVPTYSHAPASQGWAPASQGWAPASQGWAAAPQGWSSAPQGWAPAELKSAAPQSKSTGYNAGDHLKIIA